MRHRTFVMPDLAVACPDVSVTSSLMPLLSVAIGRGADQPCRLSSDTTSCPWFRLRLTVSARSAALRPLPTSLPLAGRHLVEWLVLVYANIGWHAQHAFGDDVP